MRMGKLCMYNCRNFCAFFLCAIIATGCAKTTSEYAGLYLAGFEMSAFSPCDGDEIWWLDTSADINKQFWDQIEALRNDFITEYKLDPELYISPNYFLRASGLLSKRGQYGHLGAYDRAFTVTEYSKLKVASLEEESHCSIYLDRLFD